ncbi:ATP-binding cassette subfamily C protein CydC [Methylobacter tundripaludum]|uniref:ATP-binding cassette subfamily C protein CydC n=1 Tax=Methylobacter tundripaludum TaxID=173365 RepID=A0A2S6GZI8_9GAMM|nr:thiol reductant ABC exporter subunit CydC [Methylobacter tundripaludum]PPK70659.1 ATP-binding cassette subfamily C protein CydC [Methylobacter tundripaludum]
MKDLWFFLKLFKPHSGWLSGGIILSLLTAFASVALLTLSGWFISASAIAGLVAVDGNTLAFNFMLPAAQIRALAITRTLGRYGERVVTHEATFRVLAGIRCWFFRQLIPLVPGRLSTMRSGDLLSRMTADIDALDALYLRLLAPAIVAAIGVTAVTVFLAFYAPVISLATGLMLVIASVWTPWVFNRLGRAGAEEIVVLAANFRIRQLDMIQGLADLIANRAYGRFSDKLGQFSDLMIDIQRRNNRLSAVSSAFTLLLSQVTLLMALVLAAIAFQDGLLSGADSALVVFCVTAAFELVTPLPQAMQMLAKTQKAARRIRQITEMPPTIIPPTQAIALPDSYGLQLNDVSFRYSDQQDRVLKNINLTIPQGGKIAIVGPSGSGKTTLLQLIMRYYDPEQGSVLLGGQNIKQFDSDELMSCFGVLSQRSQLFAATIKENLLIAKPDASATELNAAIKAAGLENFIAYLPEGLDTWVGESGVKVSGGEARRIALARLYLKNAPVLVLDEPTEGLDADTERDVFTALADFARDKTVIMVTHREAGLGLVDVVYGMEQGVLREL